MRFHWVSVIALAGCQQVVLVDTLPETSSGTGGGAGGGVASSSAASSSVASSSVASSSAASGGGTGGCAPSTCEDLGIQCGPLDDGCGGVVACGDCPAC